MAFAAYAMISAVTAAWLARSTAPAPEAVNPPKRWLLFDVFLAFFWPLGFYIWACNTDMKWASCTTRDGWSEK